MQRSAAGLVQWSSECDRKGTSDQLWVPLKAIAETHLRGYPDSRTRTCKIELLDGLDAMLLRIWQWKMLPWSEAV